jgi:hypothetical protein
MRLLTFSGGSLRRDGYWWVRMGSAGPGLHAGRLKGHSRGFSIRNGLIRYLKLGSYAITYMPALGSR